jgi:hypothetical protein
MDYCNSFADARTLARAQKAQNAAARRIKSAKKYDSVTPLFISLKYLPVESRLLCEILILVLKALYDQEHVSIYSPQRPIQT